MKLHASNSPIERAIDTLIRSGRLGFIWLDQDLVVTRTSGSLSGWLETGTDITQADPLLSGYGDLLHRIMDDNTETLLLPNVTIRQRHATYPTFTIEFTQDINGGLLATLFSLPAQREHEFEVQRLVRDHRENERKLRGVIERQNAELERANTDLAAFAHLISHDLKAPMRALRHTLKAPLKKAARSSDVETEDTEKAHALLDRMDRMLNGLLDYAKIGHKPEQHYTFDLRDLMMEILNGLDRTQRTSVSIMEPMPTIKTAIVPLDLTLRNLIDNALKYAAPDPDVRVTAHTTKSDLVISVSDNGPGIPTDMREYVLRPFAQLDRDDEEKRDGVGLGLASIMRTLETVGGTLSITDATHAQTGTCFTIEWPLMKM